MLRDRPEYGRLPADVSSADLLGMLEQFGSIGYWRVDLQAETVFWSGKVCESHGVPFDFQPKSVEDAINWYHPDDRADVAEIVEHSILTGEPFQFLKRIARRCGTVRWVESVGKVEFCDGGTATAIYGTFRDLTEEIEKKSKLEEAVRFAERVSAAIDEMDDALVMFDEDDKLILFNNRYLELYPESAAIIKIGVSFEELIRFGLEHGQYLDGVGCEEVFLEERMRLHLNPEGPIEQCLPNGRWCRVSEKLTRDGARVGFRIDVTEMKQLEQKLLHALKEARSANVVKDKFLSNMSHELRTPLNAIIGFSQVLQMLHQQNQVDDQVGEYATDIANAGTHLLAIIEDIFSVALMQAEIERLTLEPVNVTNLLDDIQSLTGTLARAHNQTVIFTGADCPHAQIIADREKIKKVLVNLISNAIKFSPEGTSIRVSIDLTDSGRAVLSVTDQGPGIPEAYQDKIFERFERLEATKHAIEGIGVGLTIVKELVTSMGGEIGVASREGEGSTFWLKLDLEDHGSRALAG